MADLVKIAACANAFEAEQLRNVLQQNAVVAFLDGDNMSTTLSQAGALAGVRVFVQAPDADAARRIVERMVETDAAQKSPWYCGRCIEVMQGTFELCWSCGSLRADVEGAMPAVSIETEKLQPIELPYEEPDTAASDSNPYASPQSAGKQTQQAVPNSPGDVERANEIIHQAWRAAIVANLFLPIVMHVYSLYLLIRAATISKRFFDGGERLFFLTLLVNVIGGLLWTFLIVTRLA